MHVIFDERQTLYSPSRYFRRGAFTEHPDQPLRAILIRDALLGAGFDIQRPRDFGEAPIKAVHSADYVDFWKDAPERWRAAAGDAEPIPHIHAGRGRQRPSASIFGQFGYYTTDTSTPLNDHVWDSAYWSSQTAIEAAERILEGERVVYALCRPSGHHAKYDAACGVCIFNNASIAAQHLTAKFEKVAILDIDAHAGNGSQEIFYERGDVLVCSLHIDPNGYPVHFWGYEDECGEGEGLGTNVNLPVAMGASEEVVLARFQEGVRAVTAFEPQALVVSLGLDLAHDDPLSASGMTEEGFRHMAQGIMDLGLPTVLVQEGGYLGPSLARNAVAFLTSARDRMTR